MSKHRKRSSLQNNKAPNNSLDLNNIDLSQMGSLLNNIDMNQVSSLMSNLNLNNSGSSDSSDSEVKGTGNPDRRVELLKSLMPLVDEEKSRFIEAIIQLYSINKILKNR